MPKPGDQYQVPAGEGEHEGHTVTILRVQSFKTALPEDQWEPPIVYVECSCGDKWSYVDEATPHA